MLSTREAYGIALAQLGGKRNFYVLDADLSKATQTRVFAEKYPERFFDIGIAEANMMDIAAGISSCGVPVVVSTFAAFAAGRAYDQVRNGIVYPNCNVKICATHGGILIGADGGSHQCIEDIALMRVIPNMTVLCPADEYETADCLEAALNVDGPVYMRMGRVATPAVYAAEGDFVIGKGRVLREGEEVVIVAIGDMVHCAVEAAEKLSQNNIDAAVIDMASVKPMDRELLARYAQKASLVVTAEDHNIMGGLGGAVAEVLATECPRKMKMVGVQDKFGRSGTTDQLAELYGLTADAIVDAVKLGLKG